MSLKRIIGSSAAAILLFGAMLGASSSEVADAVMKNDHSALRALIEQRADVNAQQADGATALHWAAYREDLEAVELLLDAGADANVANRNNMTPLLLASLNGNAAIIDRLLRAGADANERGPNGETPLMMTARNGSPDALKLLLAAGADVNATEDLRTTTALMWAAERGYPDAVRVLVEAGADWSAQSGAAGVPRPYLAPRVRRTTPNLDGNLPLPVNNPGGAAAFGLDSLPGLRPAVPQPAPATPPPPAVPPSSRQPDENEDAPTPGAVGTQGGGLTALVFAAREGHLETVKALVEMGADVNQVTYFSWTPLLTAVKNNHYNIASYLLDNGADPNLANDAGWNPLYLATDNRNIEGGDYPVRRPDMDHMEFIKKLLTHGANVNARLADSNATTETRTIFTMQWFYEEGATPFVRAAQSADVELMRLLLEHGADPMIPTTYGDTALSAAAGIGWVEGVTNEWSDEAHIETIKMLLELGLDPNSQNGDGRGPLHGAAHKGRTEAIQLLVDAGARLDLHDNGSRDTLQNTPYAGHTWQPLDYAEGLVRVGVQSAVINEEAADLLRALMTERGMPVPPKGRTIDSICIVPICMGDQQ